jgi:uncharacterized protein (TIGR02284 family)
MSTNGIGVIEDLVETLEDGAAGFEKLADLLDDDTAGEVGTEMRRFAEERKRFSAELRELAAGRGEEIKESGSVGGTAHRAWMTVKDSVTGDDPHAVLAAAEEGEDHSVQEFEDALNSDLPADIRDVVARQAMAVRQAHDKVRAIRDSYAS